MSSHNILSDLADAEYMLTDPGDAGTFDLLGRSLGQFAITTAAAETRTLAAPLKAGLEVGISLSVDGGDLTVTVTGGFEVAGTTALVFDDAGDSVRLYSVKTAASTYAWRIAAVDGVTGPVGQETSTFPAVISNGDIDLADGGTVTQITSIATGVTLNTHSGQITTVSSTLAAAAEAAFVVTNSTVAATDVVIANLASTSSAGTPVVSVTAVAAGSFTITIANLHASAALDNTMVINFGVIGGSAS